MHLRIADTQRPRRLGKSRAPPPDCPRRRRPNVGRLPRRISTSVITPSRMLCAEGREESIGSFGRHKSVDQAIVEFVQSASCGAPYDVEHGIMWGTVSSVAHCSIAIASQTQRFPRGLPKAERPATLPVSALVGSAVYPFTPGPSSPSFRRPPLRRKLPAQGQRCGGGGSRDGGRSGRPPAVSDLGYRIFGPLGLRRRRDMHPAADEHFPFTP